MKIRVGDEAYYRLTPKLRWPIAVEALADYSARPDRKHDVAQSLEQEVYAVRVDVSFGPPGRPDLADPVWDILHNTYFRSAGLGGGITLYCPSAAQLDELLAIFESDRALGIPGRYWVSKTRRVGGSFTIGQWIRTRTSRGEGQSALVTAHDVPTSETMFREIYKVPWQNDPLQEPARYANKRNLLFERLGSSIIVMPVKGGEGKAAGTGQHRIHWAEILRYEEIGVDVEDLITNQLSTMPQGVETFACGESSGRGDGGVAYDWYQEAYNDPTSGDLERAPECGWRSIFLASYQRWDAFLKVEDPSERQDILASLSPEEDHLVNVLKVDRALEHVKWRRWYEATQIKARSPLQRKALMRQECPITFSDCFQSKGSTEFDGERIRELLLSAEITNNEPEVGDLAIDSTLYDDKQFRYLPKTPTPKWKPRDDGEILVWGHPVGGIDLLQQGKLPHRYCMGVDISEGGEEGNYSVVLVHDRDTKALVAAYRGKAQHAALLRIVRLMSKYYNDAIIANEVNRFKQWTEDLAATDRGRFMYVRRGTRTSMDQDRLDEFGWLTTPQSKDVLVEALHGILENVPQWIRWKVLLEEMRSFKRERKALQKGKRRGVHDDTVMAAGISWYCDRDMPKPGKDPLAPSFEDEKTTPLQRQWKQWQEQQRKIAAQSRRTQGPAASLARARRQF